MTPAGTAAEWPRRVASVLAEPSRLRLLFQPIVDLQRGVVAGYETLARFSEPDGRPSRVPPDQWFAAAGAQGVGARLEGLVVRRCLDLLRTVPPNCFLTVNVSPHLLTDPELAGALLAVPDLAPLVLELTEHQDVTDLDPLIDLRDRLRSRGALLAVDDAGSGYSGLQQIAAIKPQLVKLDRAIVNGVDGDEVKLALTELLGEFAGRIDAWLLAEGIEAWSEVEALLRLGVPLGQGWLFGRPGPAWPRLDPGTAAPLRFRSARARLVEHVASLVEEVPVEGGPAGGVVPGGQTGLRVDPGGRPQALLLPRRRGDDDPGHRIAPVSLRVPVFAGVREVARRAAARPEHSRFDPIVCVDDVGVAVGVVRVERLLLRLAAGG
ncbi:EAL domain-containing protein [Geodermatophilus poikilotrophus]|uniref:EAL domain, c-di-GMP-specific phosphodiesterase class I (Or its enzymatically inactive variant) n=1 Tax=Geodermatophilus poikilotrophus TaxID=1333667 RepID=A0A1I0HHY0_9ACTN|nr:EAL domain-containing protein [Geodermatophilus poikilotrophus]SET82629.1 EAL domain, c-di-GMP-specific phosphodiesterase class I (or its enzymatically inactive variant) [Geodermatophilus poikilotrophus]